MPLKLNVGVSRKLGLPGYGSAGASCNLELELEPGLLDRDPDGFRDRLRAAYAAAEQAVADELRRLRGGPEAEGRPLESTLVPAPAPDHGPHGGAGSARGAAPPGDRRSRATPRQVAAPAAMARRQGADLAGLVRDDFGAGRPEDLTRAQTSRLIDVLRAAARA